MKALLRNLVPYGLLEARRRRWRLGRLGLSGSALAPAELEKAVADAHFELWPEFLRQQSGWTLLDVGANEGEFIRAACQLARPAQVMAFEPQPGCAAALQAALSSSPKGRLVAAAVGAAPGEVQFHCTGNSRMASVLPPQESIKESYESGAYEVVRTVTVPVVTLDDTVPAGTSVSLLKLDVQGYELQALRGAARVLRETKAVLVEANYVPHYEGAVDFDTLHRFLSDAGFHLHGISAPFTDGHRPLWADAMYVNRSL